MSQVFWEPSEKHLTQSFMAQFLESWNASKGQSLKTYEDLFASTTQDVSAFWQHYLKFSGLIFEGELEPTQKSADLFFEKSFFPSLRLSYAENLLQGYSDDDLMLVSLCEEGSHRREWKRSEVIRAVATLQGELHRAGVSSGDRVAALLPNCAEAVIAMMAVTGLGAVWSSCSPDFGDKAVKDRFEQVEPKFLFLADQVLYNSKTFDLSQKNAALLESLPSVQASHTFKHFTDSPTVSLNVEHWNEGAPKFERVAFDHPLFVMFSSGTTGKPKCIVHGVGGTTLQHSKELQLHCDLNKGENFLYYTTCGWMMWNWAASALLQGAVLYCYDGSPAAPHSDSMWEIVEKEKINVFGTSAKFIASCRSGGLRPGEKQGLRALRLLLSTGSPLLPEDFDYVYESVSMSNRSDGGVQLASICGGTDILSCFMLGTPLKPVVRGEIQCRGLGMDVQAWNSQGKSVVGEQAELVCTQPFPSMPVGFWKDEGNSKFKSAYFEEFPGVWHHGDYIQIGESGGVSVFGRSDATLNPGGVRIGTAEIYRQVETHPSILDSLAVGRTVDGDEQVELFVVLKEGVSELNNELIAELKKRIRAGASPRHVPAKIWQVDAIPYTVSGKKVEIAVKKILRGELPGNREALKNPESLDCFEKFVF